VLLALDFIVYFAA